MLVSASRLLDVFSTQMWHPPPITHTTWSCWHRNAAHEHTYATLQSSLYLDLKIPSPPPNPHIHILFSRNHNVHANTMSVRVRVDNQRRPRTVAKARFVLSRAVLLPPLAPHPIAIPPSITLYSLPRTLTPPSPAPQKEEGRGGRRRRLSTPLSRCH